MKTLSALIAGGALTLGMALAQDAPKPANPAAPAAQTQKSSKVKKHRKHHKKSTSATPAVAPATVAPQK